VDRLPRLIDANLNRAREGLRVLEDLARFELDDAALSERAKQIRHGIRTAAEFS
jgi:thiamine-phosphate pyrophosphorylase